MLRSITTTIIIILSMAVGLMAQPLSGTFYIGNAGTAPGGANPEFSTLGAAVAALNAEGVSGDVTFFISSDLTEDENVFLGVNTNGNNVTFRPAQGVSAVVTFNRSVNNSSVNGAFVIGVSADDWDALVPTANITIDGSNNGSNTRNLTFRSAENAGTSNFFRFVGALTNVTWKNTIVEVNQLSFDTMLISPLRRNDTDFVPQNLTIHNNKITSQAARTSSRAINVWGVSGTGFSPVETIPGPINISDNEIHARRYGVWLRTMTGETNITGNIFYVSEAGNLAAYGVLVEDVLGEDVTIRINGNQFRKLETAGIIRGISLESQGNVELFNNMMTGFATLPSDADIEFYGVHVQTPATPQTISVKAYHNTIYMNPLNDSNAAAAWRYRGFQSNSNARIAVDFKNNIVFNDDTSNATSFAYYQFGGASDVTSDFNNLYAPHADASTNTYLGRFSGSGGVNLLNLDDWQEATSLDGNSVSLNVNFEGDSDLRLADGMQNITALLAPRLNEVLVDFAGSTRPDPTFRGAHEPEPATSVGPVADVPSLIHLHQNYPNPFNPSTTIQFDLNQAATVTLSVYSIDGRLISTLVQNENRQAGTHFVTFNATNLASGMYLYRLSAAGQVSTGRMMLVK